MLLSGIWKLAAMAGVIGVGLVAVYQAQQGMPKTTVASHDGGEGESGESGEISDRSGSGAPDLLAAADPASVAPPETPKEENPFGDNPFGSLGRTNKSLTGTDATGTGAAGPNPTATDPGDEEPNPFDLNRTRKPASASPLRSGPGIDFRSETALSPIPAAVQDENTVPQDKNTVQPTGFEEAQPKRLPDDVDALERDVLKSANAAESARLAGGSQPGSKPTAVRPFVRQTRSSPENLNEPRVEQTSGDLSGNTSSDPFDGLGQSTPEQPVAPTAADPFDANPASTPSSDPMPTSVDELPERAHSSPSTAPKPESGFGADPFAESSPDKEQPRTTEPGLSVPANEVPTTSSQRPLALPVEDLSSPFSPSEVPRDEAKRDFGDAPELAFPSDHPRRGNGVPRLPTEIPDPVNNNGPTNRTINEPGNGVPSVSNDFPATPSGRNSKAAREPEPLPERGLPREAATTPNRRAADSIPRSLDNDLVGDGTVNKESPRGIQQARLTIEKIAPQQTTLGEPLIYSVVIKNIGGTDAHQVLVEDRIPRGTELSGTAPRAEMIDKRLIWRIGTLKPNEEKKISIRVIPRQEGQVGSVARVSFATEVAAEILVAAPQLSFNVKAPRQARIGETIELTFLLKNTGTAAATNVSVRDLVPAGLKHEAASDIECPIGRLAPNESREIVLNVTAVKPGGATNRAVLSGDAGIHQELETSIEVIGEQLVLTRSGQTKVYVDRPTRFTNSVKNEGNAEVKRVRVSEVIPAGMEFVEASDGGRFDPVQRAILWDLGALPPGGETAVSSMLVARSPGTQQATVTASGPAGSSAAVKSDVDVVGRPELQIETVSRTGVVAVGDRLTSKIQLKNHGSAAARNVSLSIRLPRELKLVEVRGGKYSLRDNAISFDPVTAIGPKEMAAFELVMEAVSEADAQMNLEISADHLSKPARRSETVQIAAEIR
jgi:uncharacterized repeat protein (TIGR01451 family)